MEANLEMSRLIGEFPANLTEALEIAAKISIQAPEYTIHNVVICGMGGSGIGGRIVSQWLADDLSVPVGFCQDYELPAYVNKHSLVIASSYSGNTEETLISLETAIQKGAKIVAVTSGGKLAEICRENGFDYVLVPGGNPPRTALAFSIVQLVAIFNRLGMCADERLAEIKRAQGLLVTEQDHIRAEAKELAEALKDKIPVVYATSEYEGLTIRARQQFNENAKKLCISHALPEMNHNELVGWGGGDSRFGVLFLNTLDLNARNQKRLEITLDRIGKKTETLLTLEAKGNSRIEKTIYLNNVIDWTSLYIAELNQVDSIEIEIIDHLKGSLAKL